MGAAAATDAQASAVNTASTETSRFAKNFSRSRDRRKLPYGLIVTTIAARTYHPSG